MPFARCHVFRACRRGFGLIYYRYSRIWRRIKPFSRVYLEITNCCNLACSFCPGTTRRAAFLTVAQFTHLAGALRGQTRFLYFHVMGEPLLHPDLLEQLDIAGRMGFRVVLTTNGTLLPKRQRELLAAPALHKVSVSLHSFEANSGVDMEHYLAGCTDFGLAASETGILIDYRLWNLDGAETRGRNEQNDAILNHLHAAYPGNWTQNTWGWRLCDRTFIHYGEKFDWPSPDAPDHGEAGTCRALRDQLAVLCDGTVVPCCLDGEGRIPLGNLLAQPLDEILAAEPARSIAAGFALQKRLHPLCRRCGYAQRFR